MVVSEQRSESCRRGLQHLLRIRPGSYRLHRYVSRTTECTLLTLTLCQGGHRGLNDGSRTGRAALPNNAKTGALDALPLIRGVQEFVQQQVTRWRRRQWDTDG